MLNLLSKCILSVLLFTKNNYYINGVRRSGNHAFIYWLSNALSGEDTEHKLLEYGLSTSLNKKSLILNNMNPRGRSHLIKTILRHPHLFFLAENIIISTEDFVPPKINPYSVIKSKKIVIHRGVLNTICSRLKKANTRALNGEETGDMIIDHGFMKCLRWINTRPDCWYKWSYEKWMSDDFYRKEFLKSMNLSFDSKPSISHEGGGSSFGTLTPTYIEVTRRFELVKIPKRVRDLLLLDYYRALLSDEEFIYLHFN